MESVLIWKLKRMVVKYNCKRSLNLGQLLKTSQKTSLTAENKAFLRSLGFTIKDRQNECSKRV